MAYVKFLSKGLKINVKDHSGSYAVVLKEKKKQHKNQNSLIKFNACLP